MRTHMASIPVARETAPQTPPRTRLSGLRRRARSFPPTWWCALAVLVGQCPAGRTSGPCRSMRTRRPSWLRLSRDGRRLQTRLGRGGTGR